MVTLCHIMRQLRGRASESFGGFADFFFSRGSRKRGPLHRASHQPSKARADFRGRAPNGGPHTSLYTVRSLACHRVRSLRPAPPLFFRPRHVSVPLGPSPLIDGHPQLEAAHCAPPRGPVPAAPPGLDVDAAPQRAPGHRRRRVVAARTAKPEEPTGRHRSGGVGVQWPRSGAVRTRGRTLAPDGGPRAAEASWAAQNQKSLIGNPRTPEAPPQAPSEPHLTPPVKDVLERPTTVGGGGVPPPPSIPPPKPRFHCGKKMKFINE